MLEYSKEVLQKVSFDQKLFIKELIKALKWLKPNEKQLLITWCLVKFGTDYTGLISPFLKSK
jgi:hypothetical protein